MRTTVATGLRNARSFRREMRFSDADGELAVRIAREAIEAVVEGRAMRPADTPRTFEEKGGAFVTLNVHPSGELRGCIGYPEPFFALLKSVVKGAEDRKSTLLKSIHAYI